MMMMKGTRGEEQPQRKEGNSPRADGQEENKKKKEEYFRIRIQPKSRKAALLLSS